MRPALLSRQLRTQTSPDLRRRRWLVGLSMVGVGAGVAVSLYQTGIIRHLPDPPPKRLWDSDKVDASSYAYKRADTPDALIMLVSYAVTALLAGAGGMGRAARRPWLPIVLLGKVLFDAGTALKLGQEEWQDNRKLCAYCQAATLASLASVALAVPEAARAVARLRR